MISGRVAAAWRGAVLLAMLSLIGFGQTIQFNSLNLTAYPVPTANAYPEGIVQGPDSAMWFAEALPNKIGRITTNGVVREFPVETAAFGVSPFHLTVGPDRNLWFTEGFAVGRMTLAGTVTTFRLPADSSNYIAAGRDGALWLTGGLSPTVYRLGTDGSLATYPAPGPCISTGLLRGITSGPDGALWFTDNCNLAIGRITIAGVITEYPIPGLLAKPDVNVSDEIVSAPDRTLWFTEDGVTKSVGRITMDGQITEYFIGFPTRSITRGPDGAMWFLTDGISLIGRITLAGEVTLDAIPTVGIQITLGPDSTLWYSDYTRNAIVKVDVPVYSRPEPRDPR